MRSERRGILVESGVVSLLLALAAAPVGATTATPTATVRPTPSVGPIQISCEIRVHPPEPRVGDAVTVRVDRRSTGLGYPGYELLQHLLFGPFTRIGSDTFRLSAVEEGTTTVEGSTTDEFINGYVDGHPIYTFRTALCSKVITVGSALTPTATRPTATPTATEPIPTPTFTPTSCVSDTPSVEEEAGSNSSLRRRLTGFNRGLFCSRAGVVSVSGAETLTVQIDCNAGTYTADILLNRANAISPVTVCHVPGHCGSVGCRTVQLEHASARSFSVNTVDDGSDETPGDDRCATESGDCSLRAAVQEANAHPDGGTTSIRLEPRTHAVTLDADDDISAAAGDLDVTSEISISGAFVGSAIAGDVEGLPPARQPAFTVHDEGRLLLSDLTIRGAHGWQGGGQQQRVRALGARNPDQKRCGGSRRYRRLRRWNLERWTGESDRCDGCRERRGGHRGRGRHQRRRCVEQRPDAHRALHHQQQ